MINALKEMVEGKDGGISTIRVATITTVVVILGIYVAQNVISMLHNAGYVDFPSNSVMVLLIVLGAKVGQHVSESITKPTE